LSDPRIEKFARVLVDYSACVKPGDKVGIITTFAAEPLVKSLYSLVLERGAYPNVLFEVPDQDELLFRHAPDELLDITPRLQQVIYEESDVFFKVRATSNTHSLGSVDPARVGRYQKALAPLLRTQMTRGADRSLRWVATQFPTHAYALEADMGLLAYQDFFYSACHVDGNTDDPVAYWQGIEAEQPRIIDRLQGHDKVEIRGPNAELTVSVKDRIFMNACGKQNMPDGEVYTGPVEDSVNGWVRFTYPAVYQGNMVNGVELKFENGQVVKATAERNEAFLQQMLAADPGARYVGEFAIGTNYEINRFTHNILLDEKIGGSFHLALGAGYPETGNKNRSVIHWDMICDLRQDSEILLDGEVIYRNGKFVF